MSCLFLLSTPTPTVLATPNYIAWVIGNSTTTRKRCKWVLQIVDVNVMFCFFYVLGRHHAAKFKFTE